MAFVILTNRKAVTMTHEQALALDKVMQGIEPGAPKQQEFAKRVKKIYFSQQPKLVEGWWVK